MGLKEKIVSLIEGGTDIKKPVYGDYANEPERLWETIQRYIGREIEISGTWGSIWERKLRKGILEEIGEDRFRVNVGSPEKPDYIEFSSSEVKKRRGPAGKLILDKQ